MANATMTFNQAQRDVLGIVSCLHKEEDIQALKLVLIQFLNERLQAELDNLWDSGAVDEKKMDSWKTAHFRTEYK